MPNEISVRQWQERFRAGSFDSEEQAGWEDFYDPPNDHRLQTLARLVMGITDLFILDHHYVWFKDNTPAVGPFYGDVRFMPLDEDAEKYFMVSLDCPHGRKKWSLFTERYGFDAPEFDCRNVRDMIKYMNVIGPELERDVQPPFIAEKCAVIIYAKLRGDPAGIQVYRDGDHRFSYASRRSRQMKTVLTAVSLEDTPPGFVSEHTHSIKGMYVYCPEDAGIPLPGQVPQVTDKSQKRKEPER